MSRKRQNTSQHATRQDPNPLTPGRSSESSSVNTGSFPTASRSTIKGRVIHKARRTGLPSTLRTAHLQNLHSLNSTFFKTIQETLKPDPSTTTKSKSIAAISLCGEFLSYQATLDNAYSPPLTTTLLTFGTGDCGQLGFGIDDDKDLMIKRPRNLHSLSSTIAVAAGGLHNVAVKDDGSVYTWGCNDDGSCGRDTSNKSVDAGTATPDYMPATVAFPRPVEGLCAAAGDCQSVLVAADGTVWVWGSYKDKEGKPIRDGPAATVRGKNEVPVQVQTGFDVEGGVKAVGVACGASFNAVRTSDGRVATWGLGECGELARPVSFVCVCDGQRTLENNVLAPPRSDTTLLPPLF